MISCIIALLGVCTTNDFGRYGFAVKEGTGMIVARGFQGTHSVKLSDQDLNELVINGEALYVHNKVEVSQDSNLCACWLGNQFYVTARSLDHPVEHPAASVYVEDCGRFWIGSGESVYGQLHAWVDSVAQTVHAFPDAFRRNQALVKLMLRVLPTCNRTLTSVLATSPDPAKTRAYFTRLGIMKGI